MARLMVLYDPNERISGLPPDQMKALGVKEVILSIPDDLEGRDIYALAQKLAGMLLEQL